MAYTLNTAVYAPGPVPEDPKQLKLYLEQELRGLQAAIAAIAAGHLDKTNQAPAKPRDGDVRYADGTNWNPGSGQGLYAYYSSAWHFLG